MTRRPVHNQGVTFGETLAFSSLRNAAYHRSDDKLSFQISFPDTPAAGVGTPGFDTVPETGAPVHACVYSAVIPVTGKNLKTSIVINGFGFTQPGTNAKLIIIANDQQKIVRFVGNPENEAYTASLKFLGPRVTAIRLTILMIAEQDSAHPGASALLAVTDISADVFVPKKPKRAAAPTVKAR